MSKLPIDKSDWETRREKLSTILSSIADHALIQSSFRCPYKNKHDLCTAKFKCRNQKKAHTNQGKIFCAGDDKLDYRNAWESQSITPDTKNKKSK